jgi:transposase-like protein
VAKRRVGRYPKECRRTVVEHLKSYDNIVGLAQELGLHRRLLYKWRDQPVEHGEPTPSVPEMRQQVRQFKRLLAEKSMEVDFSKVPCKKSRLDASGARSPKTRLRSKGIPHRPWPIGCARLRQDKRLDAYLDEGSARAAASTARRASDS